MMNERYVLSEWVLESKAGRGQRVSDFVDCSVSNKLTMRRLIESTSSRSKCDSQHCVGELS